MAAFRYSIPDSNNLQLLREQVRAKIRFARFFCADLSRSYYWDGKALEVMVADAEWVVSAYPDTLSDEDLEVLQLAADIAANELQRRERIGDPAYAPLVAGYVYVLSTALGFYKIGCTTRPQNRILTFGVQLPFDVDVMCWIFSRDMYRLETRLHREFAHKRVRGEWFTLDAEDVSYLKGLKE